MITIPDRIYAQYRNQPNAVKWYKIIPDMAGQFIVAFDAVRASYDIDKAEGDQLDVIGRIVVIDRSYEAGIVFKTSNWGGSKIQFGAKKSQFANTTGKIDAEVSDIIFRKLIKAKIVKNNSDATIDGILQAIEFITGDNRARVIDPGDMTFSVAFGKTLTEIDKMLLSQFDILPRPQGVRFAGYTDPVYKTIWGGAYVWGNGLSQFWQYNDPHQSGRFSARLSSRFS